MYPSIELGKNEVDLWEVALDVSGEVAEKFVAILSAEEVVRMARFVEPQAARQYAISRGSLRGILSRYLGKPTKDIVFTTTGDGKPALAAPNSSGFEFNTSHSGALALIGVTRGRPIGVDVEQVRKIPKAVQLAERFFSGAEYRMLCDLPEEERSPAFLSIWVSREGNAKAQGLSVWHGLAKMETSERWTVVSIDLGAGYVGAVVAAGTDWRVVRRGMLEE
ncbi:MAG: 4'-phosphopantetheinyl transferase superfamily protein [Gemmatimonadaceae bacterium]